MAAANSPEDHTEYFAEEIVKHLLLRHFGIYFDSNALESYAQRSTFNEFYTSCVLFSEAVTSAWRKYYAAIDQESNRIFKSLESAANTEQIYFRLREVARLVLLPDEYIFFIVMAIFGDFCVRICRSGNESLISNAVSAAKMYILHEGLACQQDIQINSVNFLEFMEDDVKS